MGDHWWFWICKPCGGRGTVPLPPRPAPPKPFPPLPAPTVTIDLNKQQYETLLQAIGALPATRDYVDLLESCRDWIRGTKVHGHQPADYQRRTDQALLVAVLEMELRTAKKA
jgi:hypothetical protein